MESQNKQTPAKKIDALIQRIDELERQINELRTRQDEKFMELAQRHSQMVSEQREEIIRLHKELILERVNRRNKLANAKGIFESE